MQSAHHPRVRPDHAINNVQTVAIGDVVAPGESNSAEQLELATADSEDSDVSCTPAEGCPTACENRRDLDEVWLMNTRGLGCLCGADAAAAIPRVSHLVNDCWEESDLKTFADTTNADKPLVIFAHGNSLSSSDAKWCGMTVYRTLVRPAGTKPIRFVIWSWPTDKTRGLVADAQLKAARANSNAFYLGNVLSQLNPTQSVSLMGYSFGARIVAGGMHLAAGGSIGGYGVAENGSKAPMRLILMAAAIDNSALAVGHRYGLALERSEGSLFLNNYCDRVLKRYWHLDKCTCPEALGYTGLAGPKPEGAHLKQVNVCCIVGPKHDWTLYVGSPSLASQMRTYALFEPLQ